MIFQITLVNEKEGTRAGVRLDPSKANKKEGDVSEFLLSRDQVQRLRKKLNPANRGAGGQYGQVQEFPFDQRPAESRGYVYRAWLSGEGSRVLIEQSPAKDGKK